MFIAMKPHATQAEFDAVVEKVRALGLTPHPISGTERRVVAVVGNTGAMARPAQNTAIQATRLLDVSSIR